MIFHGVGGHGSAPHRAKDPVVIAGLSIVQFQSIVSRRIDPVETGILAIGAVIIDEKIVEEERKADPV